MLGVTWRGALAGGAAIAAAVAIAACSSSMSADGAFAGGPSGGNRDASSGDDAGGSDFGDAGEDAGFDGGAMRLPSALFVNASASLPAVRLCWKVGGSVPAVRPFPQQIMPASNYAGIAAGGASFMSDASPLAHGSLELDVISAKLVANLESGKAPLTCDQLICSQGSHCLSQKPPEYWALPVAPLTGGVTNVIALGGCLAQADDANASVARCGPNWNNTTGNLHVDVLPLTDSGAATGTVYVQAAQLSPGLASLLGTGGSASLSLGSANAPESDGGIATLAAEGQLLPSSPARLQLPSSLADYGTLGMRIDVSGVDAGAGNLFMTLAQAQQLVDPSVDLATFYNGGGTYLVAVMGDPYAPHAFSSGTSGPYDGTGLHVLVVRAQPGP